MLAPLASRLIDREEGGFLVDFDRRWRPCGLHEKSLEHAARTTAAFALIDAAFPGEGYDQLARHGCAFLQERMWDEPNGGFFARVDRAGRPLWDGLKHPHAVTYAARAFDAAAPLLAPGEGAFWAGRSLSWLDEVAWDEAHGGYWGSYRRDNTRYPDGASLPTPDGLDILGLEPGFKEINTQGDALETLVGLARRDPSGPAGRRARALAALITARLMQPGGALPFRYRRDWQVAPDLLRVGFQFQAARRLLELAEPDEGAATIRAACAMVDFALERGRHPAGGFCNAVTADGRTGPGVGPGSDERQWWVQIEAVHALFALMQDERTPADARRRYQACFDAQWDLVRTALFDEKHGGLREEIPVPVGAGLSGLLRLLRRILAPRPQLKSHCWKDCSHEVDAFLTLRRPHAA